MKTTKRFESAVTALYNAFHDGKLNAMDCKACAVGNIVGHGFWSSGIMGETIQLDWNAVNNSGYSPEELSNIERYFLYGVKSLMQESKFFNTLTKQDIRFNQITIEEQRELQFKGLEAVVGYLCELDGIENVMDYTKLFESKENKPVNHLNF